MEGQERCYYYVLIKGQVGCSALLKLFDGGPAVCLSEFTPDLKIDRVLQVIMENFYEFFKLQFIFKSKRLFQITGSNFYNVNVFQILICGIMIFINYESP